MCFRNREKFRGIGGGWDNLELDCRHKGAPFILKARQMSASCCGLGK